MELQESRPNTDFESQFSRKQEIYAISGVTVLTDVGPEITKDRVPVFLASGMGATPEVNKDIIKGFFLEGRRVLSARYDRTGGSANITETTPKLHGEVIRKAQAMIVAIESKGVGQVDAIGHSEGAVVSAAAAIMRPDLFRNIVFLNPAGLVGKDSVLKIIGRQLKENQALGKRKKEDGDMAEVLARADQEFTAHIKESGLKRVYGELEAATSTELDVLIGILREKGIGIAIVSSEEDFVFPTRMIDNVVSANLLPGIEVSRMPGKHNEIQYQPSKYTHALEQVLESVNEKRSKDNSKK
jgi:pimeloyl-ACP methyl ester carboxylesterase